METIEEVETEFGVLSGRDAIFLDTISHSSETILTLSGKIEVDSKSKSFQIQFTGILFQQMIECDFDERNSIVSFGKIRDSELIQKFKRMDHSSKLNSNHKHFYFRTYDSVFEIISEQYSLKLFES